MAYGKKEFWLKRNEIIVQLRKMDQMVFPITKLIEYLSAKIPLLEGDLIFTGTMVAIVSSMHSADHDQ